MEDRKFSFEGLEVYQAARVLVKEVYLLQIAQDLGYITEEDVEKIRPSFYSVAKMLSGLKEYFDRL